MKRVLKWLVVIVGGLVILLIVAAITLPLWFDPNDHKERIEALASEATGREVIIAGLIEWSLFPWLGFSATDISMANAPNFSSPHFARVGTVAARLKLLPLISGEVQIGAVSLSQLDLNLEIDAQGNDNWSSILATEAGEPAAPGEDQTVLRVAGVSIEDSRIALHQHASDSLLVLDNMRLTTGVISYGETLNFELGMAVDGFGLNGQMSIEGSIDDPFIATPLMEVTTFEFDGQLSDPALPLALSLPEPLHFDVVKTRLTVPELQVETGGQTRIVMSVVLENTPVILRADGAVTMTVGDARELLATFDPSWAELSDDDALRQLSLDLRWRWGANQARLDDIVLALDDTKLTGSVQFTDLEGLIGTFALAVDELDVDRYLATTAVADDDAADGPEDMASQPSPSDWGQMQGQVTIDRLRVGGMQLRELDIALNSNGDALRLEPLAAQLYGGRLQGRMLLQGARASLSSTITEIQMQPLMVDLAGDGYMAGQGDVSLDIRVEDINAADPIASLNGQLGFDLSDGAVYGVNVLALLRQALVLLGKAEADAQPQSSQTDFSQLTLAARIERGILTTERLEMLSPYLRVNGEGQIDLSAQTLALDIEPVLVDTPQGQGATELAELKGIAVPVQLRGSLSAPEVSVDTAKLLLATQRERLGEEKSELLDALLNQDQAQPGDLLEGLLKRKKDKKKDDTDRD